MNLSFRVSEPGSAPRNVQVRPLSSSTMVIQWDEPEAQNGQVTVSSQSTLLMDHSANFVALQSIPGLQGLLHDSPAPAVVPVGVSVRGQQQADDDLRPHAAHHLHHQGGGLHGHRTGTRLCLSTGETVLQRSLQRQGFTLCFHLLGENAAGRAEPAREPADHRRRRHDRPPPLGAAHPPGREHRLLRALLERHIHQ